MTRPRCATLICWRDERPGSCVGAVSDRGERGCDSGRPGEPREKGDILTSRCVANAAEDITHPFPAQVAAGAPRLFDDYDREGRPLVNGTLWASKRARRSKHQRCCKVSSSTGATPSAASAFIKRSMRPALGSRAPDSHSETAASEHPRRLESTVCFDQVRVRRLFSCSAKDDDAHSDARVESAPAARLSVNAIESVRWTSVVIDGPLSKLRAARNNL